MNGLIAWWARNSIAANLLMAAILMAGAYAFNKLEREVFPSTSFNGATVSVIWPGASPPEIEEQIILRIEEAVADIDGRDHINSTALEGFATINVEGDDSIDSTQFINDIKNRVDGISTLPQGAEPPIVSLWKQPFPAQFIALYGDMELKELLRLARELRDELSQIPDGSPLVTLWGELNEEVSIEVSEESLRAFGLTFDDLVRAIKQDSLNVAGGKVRTDTGNIQVAARNLADTAEDFSNIVVKQLPDGAVLRVGDVATVIDGLEDIRAVRQINGQQGLSFQVSSPDTLNIVTLSRSVNDWVDEKNAELEGKAKLVIWNDFADMYFARMELVSTNAILGLVLVLIVLLLFLRLSVAFWVTIGIAISFAGAFIFLPLVGVSLNMLSLFAFLLVIGVVVDDAIIVGENIHNMVEEGKKGVDAAIIGTQLVAKPVLFAVLTTMIAFLPFLFISGGVSQMTKHITYTIVFALTFSLVESFFILPSHLAHMRKTLPNNRFTRFQSYFADGLLRFADRYYRPLITKAIEYRYITVLTFIGFFALSASLMVQGWIGFMFQPQVQGPFISIDIRMPEGTSWSRMLQVRSQVEAGSYALKEQFNKPDFDYVQTIYVAAEEEEINGYITIVDGDLRDESTKQVSEVLRELIGDIPDSEEISFNYTMGPPGETDLSLGLEAEELDDLRLAVLDLQNFLRSLPGLYDVRNNIQSSTPELQIELLPGAERFGLTLGEVSRQIRQAFYGDEVQRLPRDGQDVRVMVRYPASARQSLATIESMRIRTADGREVPIAAVAQARFEPSFKRIERRDRQRAAKVTAQMRDDINRSDIMKALTESYMADFAIRHPNVTLAIRGDAEEQQKFISELQQLYTVALLAIYMLLAIAFGSYWQPILVMTAIPFGFMGAVYGHLIWGINFTMFSFFGVGAAAGVVVNDNLVLIDYVNRLRAAGNGAVHALIEAGVGRFRPIVLTSATTFIGLMPIMFERSTNALFLQPTIIALAFGVFFAMFVTLIFVPAMYGVGADIARFYRWCWTGKEQPSLGQADPVVQ